MTPLILDIQFTICLDICEIYQPADLFAPFEHLQNDNRKIVETSKHGPCLIWSFKTLPTQEDFDQLLEDMRIAQETIPNHRG